MTRSLRIAVADDESDMRQYFQCMLPRLGHRVVSVASTGEQLLDDCLRLRPELVVTDLKMPRMPGLEVARRLEEQDFSIPFILLSGCPPQPTDAPLPANIRRQLLKPVRLTELAQAIDELAESIELPV